MQRHIFFIGIGGIGVSGIAQLALERGDRVSGSDIRTSSITCKLSSMGATIYVGHNAEQIRGVDLVVYSSAIGENNPELAVARAKGIQIKKRAEFLSELMADKKVIAITGSHGKTTTSSLAAKLLINVELNPSVAIGGILQEDGNNARSGASNYFVAEADESDGTFLYYEPTYSIVTNIDYEHMDFYKTFDNLQNAFSKFISQTKKGGCVFYFNEDERLKSIVSKSAGKSVSFGFSQDADIYPKDIQTGPLRLTFTCMKNGAGLGEISAGLMGRHNILNIMAVIALGLEMGIDFQLIRVALKGFRGVRRRFQVKYEDKDIFIIDDYAHHPTEIAATIEAAKTCPRSRILVVFQPHRYSRTQLLMDRFARSFIKSDYLMVTDIYGAGEDPIEGVSADAIVQRMREETQVPSDYVRKDKIIERLKGAVRKDDLVLFLGAGDITKISDEFTKSIKR